MSDDTLDVGQIFDATFSATNNGDSTTGGFTIHWYIDPATQPPTVDTPATKHTRLLGLLPGKSGSWTEGGRYFFNQPGLHTIYVWVDKANEVTPECDETNNLRGWSFQVGQTPGCVVDAFEAGGDNACSAASLAATDGSTYNHNLCPSGDVDWVYFQGQAGVDYRIVADNLGSEVDLLVMPYDKCEGAPSQKADAALSPFVVVNYPVAESGPVYLQIRHYSDTHPVGDTGYRLSVTARCSADIYEPDNLCPSAREMGANGPTQRHSFCEAGDEDWLRIPAVGGHSYSLSTANWEAKSQPLLQLYNSCSGEPLLTSSPRGSLTWDAASSAPLWVKISNGNGGQPGLQSGYDLALTQSGSVSGPEEPNDRPDEAGSLASNGLSYTYAVDRPGDQDWFYFAATGGPYAVETYNLDPSTDTYLCLYPDLRGNGSALPLACDDDSGSGKGSRIWQANLSVGRYYLRVRHYHPEAGGPLALYSLRVGVGAPACTSDAYEPDNQLGEEQKLEVGGKAQTHNFCPGGEADWVQLPISLPGVYDLRAAAMGDDADPIIDLYDVDRRTLLFSNDDYQPGLSSRILWRFAQIGNYYLRLRAFGGQAAGLGTEYSLSAARTTETPTPIPITPTPTPTSTPTPTVTPTPSPTPTSAPQTLILYNRERMARYFGEAETEAMVQKLRALAAYTLAPGLVIDLNRTPGVQTAYAAWDANIQNVEAANRVADAIRSSIWDEIDRHPTINYLVLVGDDRVIPSRRVQDVLPKDPALLESNYRDVSEQSAIGQALRQKYSLTDDFYATRSLQFLRSVPFYLPDLSIGRLIENPTDIGATIDLFLQEDDLNLASVTVAGFGERLLSARETCAIFDSLRGADCSLVGEGWGKSQLLAQQFSVQPTHGFHFLYLPGLHWCIQTADGSCVYGIDIAPGGNALQRAVVVSAAAHNGLNVTSPDPFPLDIAEAYARQGALILGFTGYTPYSNDNQVALADRLLQRMITQTFAGTRRTVGDAWRLSKYHYWQEALHSENPLDPYLDIKVLHNAILYGIPMYRLTGLSSGVNEFPSVKPLTGVNRRSGTYTSSQLKLSLTDGYHWQIQSQGEKGNFYELDGHAYWSPERASQPLFYLDLRETPLGFYGPVRDALWLGGSYSDTVGFKPIYTTVSGGADGVKARQIQESPAEMAGSWEGIVPVQIDAAGERFAVHWGQFDPSTSRQRLYTSFDFELTFSGSEDTAGPEVQHASASTAGPRIKLEARDPSGVDRVIVLWTDGGGQWRPLELVYDRSMDKWTGLLPARGTVDWFAQVVDGAGNVTLVMDKGSFFHLDLTVHSLYLPGVKR
ncbi:MAG: hypothetical protein KJZ86_03275 [Caldilineaceae bacterium]|nr:hypothetical protein [Caldilineaceae bacterium]